jgi:hypothetical protein
VLDRYVRRTSEPSGWGVPWTRETAVNLERGRKRSLGAHEVLALAFVLDVHSPVELLAPGDELLPVAGLLLDPGDVRAWFEGATGPLRAWISAHGGPPPACWRAWQR